MKKLFSFIFLTGILFILFLSGFIFYMNVPYVPGFKNDDSGKQIEHLPYELKGNLHSKVMLIFIHGYPNTFRLWDETIEKVEKDYTCLSISYPNFTPELKLKWGMDLRDITFYIKQTIEIVEEKLRTQNKSKSTTEKIIVSHDFGAFITYMFEHQYKHYVNEKK